MRDVIKISLNPCKLLEVCLELVTSVLQILTSFILVGICQHFWRTYSFNLKFDDEQNTFLYNCSIYQTAFCNA
jgi:hypothetical protein